MTITRKHCSHCGADLDDSNPAFPEGTRRIAIYDRGLDCTVSYRCPDCGVTEPRSITEVLAIADPAAFKD